MRWAPLLTLVLVACSPTGRTPRDALTRTTSGREVFAPPRRYAALFEDGLRWRYTIHTTMEWASDSGDRIDGIEFSPLQLMGAQEVTCTVSEVTAHRDKVTSRIVCDVEGKPPAEAVPVAGTWSADRDGLSRDGSPVVFPDGAECSEGTSRQLCFADGGVVRGWFHSDRASSTFEVVR